MSFGTPLGIAAGVPLETGADYYIKFAIPGVHRKPRETVIRLIDVSGQRLITSLRQADPPYGTGEIRTGWIISIRRARKNEIQYAPRMVTT